MTRALALAILALAPDVAAAHEFYDPSCCSGRDCQPIPDDRVHVTPDGYLVTLRPGDGPFVTEPVERLFRYRDGDPGNDYDMPREARRSGDSLYHACVTPGGLLICFYARENGS